MFTTSFIGSSKRMKQGKVHVSEAMKALSQKESMTIEEITAVIWKNLLSQCAYMTSSLLQVIVTFACQLSNMYDITSEQAIALTKTNLSLFAVSTMF